MYLSVSQAAERLGVRPRDISDAIYRRDVQADLYPLVGGRRLVPETHLNVLAMALRRRGFHITEDSIHVDQQQP